MTSPAAAAHAIPTPAHTTRGAAVAAGVLGFLVLALQFGPLVGVIGFRLSDNALWTSNGILRDAAVAVLLVAAGAAFFTSQRRPALPASAWWALAAVLVFLGFTLSAGTSVLVALNLRRLVLMPLLFVAVLLIPWTPRQVDRIFGLVLATSVLVALFGLFEYMAPDSLWTEVLDVDGYNAANRIDRFGSLGFYDSGRFFSGDLDPWTGRLWRRMVSSYLEPTTLAAAMATLTVVAAARLARGHDALLPLCLAVVCGLATLSKGYVLFLLLLLGWRLLGMPSPRHVLVIGAVVCGLALAAPVLPDSGPMIHVSGLTSALHYLAQGHLTGEGVGNAGNYTEAAIDFGEESGLGNAIGQVGVAGLLLLVWAAVLARDVLRAAAARRDPGGSWLAAWLMFWSVTYLLSASSLGVGGNSLGFIVLALYLHPASGIRGR